MFRSHDALEPGFHFAGLPFPVGKGLTRKVDSRESEHLYVNGYIIQKGLEADSANRL